MPFEYRLRFNLLPNYRFASNQTRIELPVDSAHLTLQAGSLDSLIESSSRLILIGGPFASPDAAQADGQRARRALLLWALQSRLTIDLGDGRRRGGITTTGAELAQRHGVNVRNTLHGLDVYEIVENQYFVTVEAQPSARIRSSVAVDRIASWYSADIPLTGKQELATELYCSANFDAPPRSRFLTLMTALEALLDHQPRSKEVTSVVVALEAEVQNSSLEKDDKQSLRGSLKWLYQESISQAGRRVATALLPGRKYAGLTAPKYFRECYSLRSMIVHTGHVPPEIDLPEVSSELYRFVGDLLQAEIGVPSA